jgi:hypothetical protein
MYLQCCFVSRYKNFIDFHYEYYKVKDGKSWSHWPSGLRHGSAAARLLGLWVWIPPGAWISSLVRVVCCLVEDSALSWSLVQKSPTECGVSECDQESLIMRRPWPTGAVAPWEIGGGGGWGKMPTLQLPLSIFSSAISLKLFPTSWWHAMHTYLLPNFVNYFTIQLLFYLWHL